MCPSCRKGARTKVLLVATTPSSIDKFDRRNISILRERGCALHVASSFAPVDHWHRPSFKSELEADGVVVHDVGFARRLRLTEILRTFDQLRALIDAEKFDVVHVQTPIASAVTRLAILSLHQPRPAVLYTIHGFHFFKGGPLKNWAFYPLEAYLAKRTDIALTINSEDYLRVKAMGGKRARYIRGVGVESTEFRPATPDGRAYLRQQLGVAPDEFVVALVGELNANKNQELMVRSAAALVGAGRRVTTLLVGSGSCSKQLKELCAELGLEESVRFLGYREDVADILRAADLLVSTSYREGLPVNVIEAMFTGLPCVVTNIRGNRDLVQHGLNGYLLNTRHPDELGRAISQLQDNSNLRARMGHESRRIAMAYEASGIDERMREIYTECFALREQAIQESSRKVKGHSR